MPESHHSDSELSSIENYDELDEDQLMDDAGDNQDEVEKQEEDEEEEEDDDDDEDDGDDGADDDDDDEEEEEEVNAVDLDEDEELSEQDAQVSSDNDDDANFQSDEDFEEDEKPEKPKKQKFKLNLRLSKPVDDSAYTDEESIHQKPVRTKRKAAEPKVKKSASRPRRSTQTAVNYKDYKSLDDKEFMSDDDVIPTPALDAEGLSDDEEVQKDPTKMTERQRAKLLDDEGSQNNSRYLSLGNRTYNKPKRVLTEEENQLRKAEIARKRKNLTEKKLEEEKQETINKLLKRRAAKTSSKTKDEDSQDEDGTKEKPRRPQFSHRALFTWRSLKDSISLRIPEPLARNTFNIK